MPLQVLRMRNASAGGGASYDSVIAALTPWGYWKMLENPPTTGGVLTDSSGNTRHGTYSADTFTTAAGVWSNSARSPVLVTANSQWAQVPNFSITGVAFSVVIDFKITANQVQQLFSADNGSGNRLWQLRLDGSGHLELVFISPSVVQITTVATYALNTAHKVIMVFDPSLSAGAGRVKIYADGALAASSSTAVTLSSGTAIPYIGWRGAGTEYLGGNTNGAALFTYALSSTDCTNLWNARNNP